MASPENRGVPATARGGNAPARRGWARALGSLRVAAALMICLLVLLLLDAQRLWVATGVRSLVLAALSVNLAFALGTRRRSFRRRPALLTFHLALIGLCALTLASRALQVEGRVVLAEGQRLRLRDAGLEVGPLASAGLLEHALRLDRVASDYWGGGHMRSSHAELAWVDAGGAQTPLRAAPGEPARIHGMRLYLEPLRGAAAIWELRGQRGVIYFPDYRSHPDEQSQSLLIPGAPNALTASLSLPAPILSSAPWRFEIPADAGVELSGAGLEPARMAPGDEIPLGRGHLRLVALVPWARLYLVRDPSRTWSLVLFASLPILILIHYLSTMDRRRRHVGGAPRAA